MATRSRARRLRSPHTSTEPTIDRMTNNQAMAALTRLGREIASLDGSDDEPMGVAAPVVTGASNGDRPIHASHGPADQVPRRDDGSVSHYYGMDKEELEEWGLDTYKPRRRERADGWTPGVQAQFIRTLADCGSVTRACQAVARSRVSAYKLRRDPSARTFARAWEEAMASTATMLAETALDRALNGQEEAVYYKGERIGTRVRHDNRLLFAMLRARDPLNYAPIDELERWEARRPPVDAPDAVADRLEQAEEAWAHAPREELEATGRLPRDTATATLEREAAEAARSPEPTEEERRASDEATSRMFENARAMAEREAARTEAAERKTAEKKARAAQRRKDSAKA